MTLEDENYNTSGAENLPVLDEDGQVEIEDPLLIETEERDRQNTLDEFFSKGCGCSLFGGHPCLTAFTKDHTSQIRDQCTSFT